MFYYVRECIVGTGVNYRGQRSVTVGGIPCQAWASPLPHEHKFMSKRYRNKDLRDNLCRNPDNSTVGPWCFTTNPRPHLRHQGCGVPQCSEVACVSCNGEDYRGPMDHTQSGRECQRWDLQEPHTHLHQPKRGCALPQSLQHVLHPPIVCINEAPDCSTNLMKRPYGLQGRGTGLLGEV
ncbi:unnamed protein product [Arctogadus glacialis]